MTFACRVLIVLAIVALLTALTPARSSTAKPSPSPTPSPVAAAIALSIISADRAAQILRQLYPHARIVVDRQSNAVVVSASPDDVQGMRAIIQGIDVRAATTPLADAVQLHRANPSVVAARLRSLFPSARITTGPNKSIVFLATAQDSAQIKALVGVIDTPPATPLPAATATEAVRVMQARPADVARTVARQVPAARVAVSGGMIVLTGSAEDVARAKSLVALLDVAAPGARVTQIYRLRNVDAQSVGDLISRSYRDVTVNVDKDLNAISVLATASEQQRIADAVAQLDGAQAGGYGPPVSQPGAVAPIGAGPAGSNVEVITLKAALPGQSTGVSTTASDLAAAVTQSLQGSAPDLRITVPANSTQLVLSGSTYSIRLAKDLIDKLDVSPPLVVLDTEVLEVQETVAKTLGLLFPQPVISTTYSEIPPQAPPTGGTPPPLLGIQPFTRTPISITAQLNFLVQNGTARVLADPRVTTISGRTATIRAGDTISILTTAGGGAGTIATTQLQNFQTGVVLDITPVVNAGDSISVTLHPVVNSLAGLTNGVPQIATRDTLTTVTLKDNQTLVIGGLIQESTTRTENKLPLLGDIPLIGRILFRNQTLNHSRNELIIVVTPHVLREGVPAVLPGPVLPVLPTPRPLPTLPAGTLLPVPSGLFPVSRPSPAPAPAPTPGSASLPGPVPQPVPSAFASTNVFTFGAAPTSTYAGPAESPRIFFVSFSPTVLRPGMLVHVSAITTSNVSTVIVTNGVGTVSLLKVAEGRWQATYAFDATGSSAGQTQAQLTLTAAKLGGLAATTTIPISLTQ